MASPQSNDIYTEGRGFFSLHQTLQDESMKSSFTKILSKKEVVGNALSNWIFDRISTSKNQEEVLEALITRMINLEDEKSMYKKKAYICSLTNLLNRNFFLEFAETFEKRRKNIACQIDKNVYFFCLDLNKFKKVNDTLGHKIGDEVLIEFSNRLSNVIRLSDFQNFDIERAIANDFFVRLGGDEFIGKIELWSDDEAIIVKRRIEKAMKKPFITSKGEINIGVSIGFQKLENNKSVNDIIAEADVKMYEEKRR